MCEDLREMLKAVIRDELESILGELNQPEALVSTEVAAELYGIKAQTMNLWRSKGKGPPYVRIEGAIRYQVKNLRCWANERIVLTDVGKNSVRGGRHE